MPIAVESGHAGDLVSLGGVLGKSGQGRITIESNFSAFGSTVVANSNPKRILCLIVNNSVNDCHVALGGVATINSAILKPNGSFQVDSLNPWTGAIAVYSLINSSSIFVIETSVQ